MLKPTGFWSYTSSDDGRSRGRLSQLRALLADELQQQIGRLPEVNIFQDVAAIPPGASWERQIGEALQESSFIIPIVTPAFLQSEWCSREILTFVEREAALGRNDLVFPIHYVDTKSINPDRPGECFDRAVYDLLHTRQWVDFTQLRHGDPYSEQVARTLERIALAICKALRRPPTVSPQAYLDDREGPETKQETHEAEGVLRGAEPRRQAEESSKVGDDAAKELNAGEAREEKKRHQHEPEPLPQETRFGKFLADAVSWARGTLTPRNLTGHTNLVVAVAFSQSGRILASASWDGTVRLWDPIKGRSLHTLTGHTEAVKSVAFSPTGSVLVSGGGDLTIKLWNPVSGQLSRSWIGNNNGWVRCLAFSPDGRILASGGTGINLWDPATCQLSRELSDHTSSAEFVAFSPDGQVLASGGIDNAIRLWDPASGEVLRVLAGHASTVLCGAFSPDGRILASGSLDYTIKLWDAESGRLLRGWTGHTSHWVCAIAFSPDGRLLASGGDTEIKLWDPVSGRLLRTFEGHTNSVLALAFSPDGRGLASGSFDRTVKLWDVSALTGASN